jgi:hypothetical protein
MPQEVKVLNGQNIFDLVLGTYKDLNLTYKLIQENPDIDSINFDFDNSSNVVVSYDPNFSIPLPAPLNQSSSEVASSIKTLKLQENQSVFDACLMTYGNLEHAYKLLQDSGIDSINETDLAQRTLTYDSILIDDNALYNSIKSGGFAFATGIEVVNDDLCTHVYVEIGYVECGYVE